MTVTEMTRALGLTTVMEMPDKQLTGAIVTDLISDVLARGEPGYVWITIQTHRNVAAVASAQQIAAVILTGGREPSPDLISLARDEGIALLRTEAETYPVAGRLYELGVR